jgi:hydroxymethylpyrimidine kinase/phosphomethylpyrimidine kinase/thiamine-phosphate diphosphorylase
MLPCVWTIAGSDSGGGAGIQADLKTLSALGVHGCTIITAVTSQNTSQVDSIHLLPIESLESQWDCLAREFPPGAIKIGMLGSEAIVSKVAELLSHANKSQTTVVCDPVKIASSGATLSNSQTLAQMRELLFPQIDLLTPNVHEAEYLVGHAINDCTDIRQAAEKLLQLGVKSVLIKGGHFKGASAEDFCQDFWTDGKSSFWLTSKRNPVGRSHGTGCTLSSAIAAGCASGFNLQDSIVMAKAYINRGLRLSVGAGPDNTAILFHGNWPGESTTAPDFPWLNDRADLGRNRPKFPDCGSTKLGFYPIVDRFEWIKRLLPMGISSVQLRIKDLRGVELEKEIQRACEYSRKYHCRLFINDYWDLALKYRAYGVHLGQGDLKSADIDSLEKSGMRLGISTHCYEEVARANAYQPSYVAIGPIYATTSCTLKFAPQGLASLRRWRKMLSYPLVAIGGISLDRAPEVLSSGADGVGVISDLSKAPEPESRAKFWLDLFNH